MIQVTQATIDAWLSDREVNHVVVTFPNLNLTYTNEDVEPTSLYLKEALSNSDSMEFVGMIASQLKIDIFNVPDEVKDQYFEVSIKAGNTEVIPIFKGYADRVEIDADSFSKKKKITAFDALYYAGQKDVSSWYYGLTFPLTLKQFRDSLCQYIGITQEEVALPNDDITLRRELENKQEIPAITFLKSISQINGLCGIINRSGNLEYRLVSNKPAAEVDFTFDFCEKLSHEEFYCNPIQKIVIRDNEEDAGVTAGAGTNKYIIQNNVLAYGLAKDVLRTAAENIRTNLNELTYYPMRSIQNGMPFIEVGDNVIYNTSGGYGIDKFVILSRTLSGISFCRDTYEARGVQNQSEYITDIQAQLSALQRTASEIKSLNEKTIDYLLPTTRDTSDIADGSNSDVLIFEFYSNKEDEKTSFYSCMTYDVETSADAQTETYGDYTLTAQIYLDGVSMETAVESGGDGHRITMLNYLMQGLTKGNHTFTVTFAVSGGSISNMNFVSAYLLAASVVEDGNYSEDYGVYDDVAFQEYMEIQDQDIVGDYIELSAPTGGTGEGYFDGSKFCGDWLASMVRPIEYAQIYDAKVGQSPAYPDASDESDWEGYVYNNTNILVPEYFDNQVVANTDKHINMWFAGVKPQANSNLRIALYGVYIPKNQSFRVVENHPIQGYTVLNIYEAQPTIYYPRYSNQVYWCAKSYPWGTDTSGNIIRNVILVYNVDAFKTYLENMDTATLANFLQANNANAATMFMLAECNISKERKKKGVTDWSDNDDYHNP